MSDYLEFLEKPGCHLCEDALPDAQRLARKLGLSLRRVDIRDHDDLIAAFSLRIPVIRLHGTVVAEGVIVYRDALAHARSIDRRS